MTAIYARQSLEKKDSLSIEGQIEMCRKFTEGEVRVFQDKGFSGKNTNRPAFTELMEKVRGGEVKKILVYRLDRFSRSIADFSQIWAELERHNVEFQSVTEQFDTSSPMGRAMLNIVMTFAQLERETTAERVRDNYRHRFTLGAWPGGPAPYGYHIIKVRESDGKMASSLQVNEQGAVVRRIFEEYLKPGISLRALARRLTEEQIHGPKREAWDNVTLSRILRSPLYVRANEDVYWHYMAKGIASVQPVEAFDGIHGCNVIGRRDRGKGTYNGIERQQLSMSNHEGIIEGEVWLRVQEKLSGNRQISRERAGKYTWLTGLLKCGKCGYAIKINYGRAENRHYLICSGRSNLASCDVSIRIDLRELEGAVEKELIELLDQCPAEELWHQDDPTAKEILEVEQKIERLVTALAESSVVAAAYISKEIERLHSQRELLLTKVKQGAEGGTERGKIDFTQAGFEEKKLIAREFIDRILLDGDQVNIIWKI